MASVSGKHRSVHRAMWERENGPIPPKHEICHKCDTPPCINPAHLFCGTKSDNQRDCVAKGRDGSRRYPGTKNPQAVLNEDQVVAIFADARAQGVIGTAYGVHRTTINLIQSGKKWGWLTKDLTPVKRKMGPHRG